jgi:hypothetical protein
MRRRLPRSAWLVLVPVAAFAVGGVVGVTRAAFSTTTSNSGNALQAAANFCPTTGVSGAEMIDGFELGRITGATASSAFFSAANSANVTADSAVARYGTYSLKIVANGVATNAQRIFTATTTVEDVRFAIRFASLPSADVEVMRMGPASGAALQLMYHTSTHKLALQFSTGASIEEAASVVAGTWYLVEVKLDMTTSTWSGAWYVDEVAQTGRTVSGTAGTTAYQLFLGTTLANTYTANYDDVAVMASASNFPLGDGKVLILKPTGMGTHNIPLDFQNDDSTVINSSSYTRVDDIPASSSTDYIKQVTALSTAYIELTFDDTTETCVRLVQGDMLHDLQNTNQGDNGKTSIFDGSTERVVYSGSMTSNSTGQYLREAIIAPVSTTWSASELNGVVGRIGYSTDASPTPRWDAFLVEYEVPS